MIKIKRTAKTLFQFLYFDILQFISKNKTSEKKSLIMRDFSVKKEKLIKSIFVINIEVK